MRAEARVLALGILISVREVRQYACCQTHEEKQEFKKKKRNELQRIVRGSFVVI